MNLVELTEYLVKNLVKNTDDVIVKMSEENENTIDVIVNEEDIGRVIGKVGKIANSIRNVVQASAYINELGHVHVNIDTK